MRHMKSEPTQAETSAELSSRCEGPEQFLNFDRAFRHSLTIPKVLVVKEEARLRRLRTRRRAKKQTA
jgi:hypothetical protein